MAKLMDYHRAQLQVLGPAGKAIVAEYVGLSEQIRDMQQSQGYRQLGPAEKKVAAAALARKRGKCVTLAKKKLKDHRDSLLRTQSGDYKALAALTKQMEQRHAETVTMTGAVDGEQMPRFRAPGP